jgi:hypothetical protein
MNKTGGKRKIFINIAQMLQAEYAAAQPLLTAVWHINGNDIEMKAERNFGLDFVFDIEAK